MNAPRTAVAVLLVAALGGEARAGSPVAGVGEAAMLPVRYLEGRALDLLDAVELNVGSGRGAKASLKYGLHFFGVGEVRSWRIGLFGREAGSWRELDTEFGILPLSFAAWPVHYAAKAAGWEQLAADARFVAHDGSDGFEHLDRKELNGDHAYLWKDTVEGPVHTRWGDSFPVGVEVHALVGVRALVRPLQVVDFVVGLVGLDLDPWLTEEPQERRP